MYWKENNEKCPNCKLENTIHDFDLKANLCRKCGYNDRGYSFCPSCNKTSLKYDKETGLNQCYNPDCRWNNRVAPAAVPSEFLDFCVEESKKSGDHPIVTRKIENIRDITKKIDEKLGIEI